MQLAFFAEDSMDKRYFVDVFAEVFQDNKGLKMKLHTLDGQSYPGYMTVSCKQGVINKYPEGTIYKMDVKLVRSKKGKPYFVALNQKSIGRAIEFFDYNLKVQNGFDYFLPKFEEKKNTTKRAPRQIQRSSASFETF